MADDDIKIDFSRITRIFRKKGKEPSENEERREEEQADFSSITRHSRKIGIFLLVLIPIILSIHFRAQPFSLPMTDQWAEETVLANIRSEISANIDKQYPNLPQENKNKIINENLEAAKEQYGESLEQQIELTSQSFKSRMQDEDGQTYLLAIDPYLWYGNSRNYIENGQFGDTYKNGEDWYSLRNGRIGRKAGAPFNSIFTVIVYKIIHPFNNDFSVMSAAFLVPLIIMTLAVIPVFFLVRKFAGNIGAFFAATIFAIHPALLNRTVAGFSDTDPYTIFFPLLTFWLFFEALDAAKRKNKYLLVGLSGFSLALFNLAWQQGWWYTFDFILAAMGIYLLDYVIRNFSQIKTNFSGFIRAFQVKEFFFTVLTLSLSFAVIRSILSLFYRNESIFIGFEKLYTSMIIQPLWFIQLKQVAVTTIWPNVLTTVAELNPANLGMIVNTMGGTALFAVSVIGVALIMLKTKVSEKKYLRFAILLAIWYLASIYAAVKSLRFTALIAPVYALSFGIALGIGYDYLKKWSTKSLNMNDKMVSTILIILFLLLLWSPIKAAQGTIMGEQPSFTDAWQESLDEIRQESEDGIITSWWDFGHWFVAMGERRVTFDGGDQGNRIHWVGKSLLTENENESVAILRMLNCGQELAFDTLQNYTDNDSLQAKLLLDEIILMDKQGANARLKEEGFSSRQCRQLLEYTHCDDIIDQYYITSQDMVGKAGVWAHFGNWNFTKAAMYNAVRRQRSSEGIEILVERFGLSAEDAEKMYYDIRSNDADQWVTNWPSYVSGYSDCASREETLICQNGLVVNMTSYDAYLSLQQGPATLHSLVYAGEDDLVEKKFENSEAPYSAALVRQPGGSYKSILMMPELAKSTFTRLFFFDGLGSRYFEPLSDKRTFTGLRILVWKVNFDEGSPHVPEHLQGAGEVDNISEEVNIPENGP